jgi:biopolymer transport protein TolR
MAFSAGQGGTGRRGRRRGRGRQPLSEINVTPLVDVMLVLLIIFMISAPLLNAGVEVDLPKTEAGALKDTNEPISVTVRSDGAIFIQSNEVTYDQLAPGLTALTNGSHERPINVRADGTATYQDVARVMAKLSISGFTHLNLVTDTSASSKAAEAAAPAAPLAKP